MNTSTDRFIEDCLHRLRTRGVARDTNVTVFIYPKPNKKRPVGETLASAAETKMSYGNNCVAAIRN